MKCGLCFWLLLISLQLFSDCSSIQPTPTTLTFLSMKRRPGFCCVVQSLVSLLEGDFEPSVGLKALNLVELLYSLPDEAGSLVQGNDESIVDKRVCVKLMKTKDFMEPLLTFIISSSVEEPSSDVECLSLKGCRIFVTLSSASETQITNVKMDDDKYDAR